jgi:hypothetical protein
MARPSTAARCSCCWCCQNNWTPPVAAAFSPFYTSQHMTLSVQTAVGVQLLISNAIALNSATAATADVLLLFLEVFWCCCHCCSCSCTCFHSCTSASQLLLLHILSDGDVAPARAVGHAVLQGSPFIMVLTPRVAIRPPLALLLLFLHKEWLVQGSLFSSLTQWLAAVRRLYTLSCSGCQHQMLLALTSGYDHPDLAAQVLP